MQVLKSQVRENILSAAKKEFLKSGYNQASMRYIAAQSDITAGNIYRYFGSKQVLFDAVVFDVCKKLRSMLLSINFDVDSPLTREMYLHFKNQFVEEIAHEILSSRSEILILLNRADGTAYDSVTEEFIEIIDMKIETYVLRYIALKHSNQDFHALHRIISKGIIEAINDLISRSDSLEKDQIKCELDMIIDFYFSHIITRFDQ